MNTWKKPFGHVYFPTADDPDEYKRTSVGKVLGMTQNAIDAIDKAEPYQRGKGHHLWLLNELDIADKHHTIMVTDVRVSGGSFAWINEPATIDELERLLEGNRLGGYSTSVKHGKVFLSYDPKFYKHATPAFAIAFSEPQVVQGHPVLKTIQDLVDVVENLIPTFKHLLA